MAVANFEADAAAALPSEFTSDFKSADVSLLLELCRCAAGFDFDYERLLQIRGMCCGWYYTTIFDDQEHSSIRLLVDRLQRQYRRQQMHKQFIDACGPQDEGQDGSRGCRGQAVLMGMIAKDLDGHAACGMNADFLYCGYPTPRRRMSLRPGPDRPPHQV